MLPISLLLFTLLSNLNFQPALGSPETAWIIRTNFANPTRANTVHSMQFDYAGNILIAGTAPSAAGGDNDYALLKYSQSGTPLWAVTYNSGPGADDRLRGMALDPQGNVYVTGTSRTVKYNSNGVLQWVTGYGAYGALGLAVDTNGYVIIVGFNYGDFSTAKYTAAEGTNVWVRFYDYSGLPDSAQKVAVGPAGEVYVGGTFSWVCDQFGCYVQFGLVKYDAVGTFQWSRIWEPPNSLHYAAYPEDAGVKYAIVRENRIYLAGTFFRGSAGTYVVVGFDFNGTNAFAFNFPGSDNGMTGIDFNRSNEVFMTGWRDRAGPYTVFATTIRVGTNGALKWQADLQQANAYRKGNAVNLDSANNVFVTGQSSPNTFGSMFDFLTIKYDSNGRELWQKQYNGPANGNDIGMGILVAPDGGIFVAGHSANTSGGNDFVLIKYVELQTIQWQGTNVLLQFCATNGLACRFQGSTNLLDWQDLATVAPDPAGICRYTDTNAPAHPHRFYRTVTP